MEGTILNDFESLSKSNLNRLIDFPALALFAQNHKGGDINPVEFIRDGKMVSFSYILDHIRALDNTTFSILWDPHCCYNVGLEIRCRQQSNISKTALLCLLDQQLEDMKEEALLYARDIQRIPYWDMLIYDDTFDWCLSITHEDADDGNRMCFVRMTEKEKFAYG